MFSVENSLGGAAVYPESRVHAVHEHEAGVAAGDLGQEEAGPADHQREAETQPHNYQCISDRGGYSAYEEWHFVCKIIYNFFSQRTREKKRIHRGDTEPAPHTDTHLNNFNKVSTFLNSRYEY